MQLSSAPLLYGVLFVLLLKLDGVVCQLGVDSESPEAHDAGRSSVHDSVDTMTPLKSQLQLHSTPANQVSLSNKETEVGISNNEVGSSTCTQTESCDVCNSYHTCHWCDHDNACHAIGSYYGCSFGASCTKKKASNETDPSGCLAHTSCSECALSSHLCHWCGHDNACHAIGSVYGCVNGVDCYDNTHCKRDKPERLPHVVVPAIGLLPLIAIGVAVTFVLCCATCCCCIMGGIKSAYDDLLDVSSTPDASHYHLLDEEPPTQPVVETRRRRREKRTKPNVAFQEADIIVQHENAMPDSLTAVEEDAETKVTSVETDAEEQRSAEQLENTGDPLVADHEEPDVTSPLIMPSTVPTNRRRPRPRRAMNGMYNACFCCYCVTVAFVAISAFSAIYLYPKKPIYSICNDSVAWKSLIDSMTGMKAKAEFEILASIYNPNHLDVALDMGKGSFSHDGIFVGTYEIPPVLVEGTSVTDILIVASFTPEKWDALSIATEYYRGTLVLSVDVQASIRIPALADYTFPFALTDLVVRVNEMSDRHLCACPTWSDAKNKTLPVLSLPFKTESK